MRDILIGLGLLGFSFFLAVQYIDPFNVYEEVGKLNGQRISYLHLQHAYLMSQRHGAPHVKDPRECRMYCKPAGYDGEIPEEFPEDIEGYECQGDKCAKAEPQPPGEENEQCKESGSCSVYCSAVCCVCLRECI